MIAWTSRRLHLSFWRRGRTPSPSLLLLLGFFLFLAAVVVLPMSAECGVGSPSIMALERRVFANGRGNDLQHLKYLDSLRHGRRFLQQRNVAIVDFPVEGSSDPFTVGLYYTRVRLGNPPREFYVQIDTGSDVLWVTCNPCNGCPSTSGLPIQLEFFDPLASSTSSSISCSDQRCSSGLHTSEASCTLASSGGSACGYAFQYGDGSGTSGYYVQDSIYFDTIVANQLVANSTANVIFGCSNLQSGDLTKPDRAVDGIFGFGQHEFSVISQLSSLGVAPKVFSHCLRGSSSGGGILVLGEIVEPGIVYTPLVPYQPHYNLNLRSIAVNGEILPIDRSVFTTSTTQGTIIDSGTTLAYLADQAYGPFIKAIMSLIPQSVRSFVHKGSQCFVTASRVEDVFPYVTLNFKGGASMILKPQDYLVQQGSVENALIWCIGWQRNPGQQITILGDLVLKDKIVVYDLERQRIGWVNYDCSQAVNVSAVLGRNEFIDTGIFKSGGSSPGVEHSMMALVGLIALFVHTFIIILHL